MCVHFSFPHTGDKEVQVRRVYQSIRLNSVRNWHVIYRPRMVEKQSSPEPTSKSERKDKKYHEEFRSARYHYYQLWYHIKGIRILLNLHVMCVCVLLCVCSLPELDNQCWFFTSLQLRCS